MLELLVIGIGDIECLYKGCINILKILDFDIFLYILQFIRVVIEFYRENVDSINSQYGDLMEECVEQEVVMLDSIQY